MATHTFLTMNVRISIYKFVNHESDRLSRIPCFSHIDGCTRFCHSMSLYVYLTRLYVNPALPVTFKGASPQPRSVESNLCFLSGPCSVLIASLYPYPCVGFTPRRRRTSSALTATSQPCEEAAAKTTERGSSFSVPVSPGVRKGGGGGEDLWATLGGASPGATRRHARPIVRRTRSASGIRVRSASPTMIWDDDP